MIKGLLICVLMVAACAAPSQVTSTPGPHTVAAAATPIVLESGTYFRITPQTLRAELQDKDFVLINTHIPYEGELEQTDSFIPFDTITQHRDQLPADLTAPIVLYCRSGRMSTIAAEALVKAGYTNVWELAGGMLAWEQAGLTVVHR